MDILTLNSITGGYGKDRIVKDVTFSVLKGSVFGMIGPNGAGKTTIFRMIGRTMKPWQGALRFNGVDIESISRREFARNVAVVPQFRSVPPPFTVEEFVSLGRYPHGGRLKRLNAEDERIIGETMALLKVEEFRKKRVNALSGGEMQRVFLAQGLVQSPKLILMDEPTAHLDIGQKMRTLDLMRSLSHEQGLTVLVILHDLNLASAYCDRIAMLCRGEVHAMGTPEEVFTEENVTRIYQTPAKVGTYPGSSKPHIFFLPQSLHQGGTE